MNRARRRRYRDLHRRPATTTPERSTRRSSVSKASNRPVRWIISTRQPHPATVCHGPTGVRGTPLDHYNGSGPPVAAGSHAFAASFAGDGTTSGPASARSRSAGAVVLCGSTAEIVGPTLGAAHLKADRTGRHVRVRTGGRPLLTRGGGLLTHVNRRMGQYSVASVGKIVWRQALEVRAKTRRNPSARRCRCSGSHRVRSAIPCALTEAGA